VRASVPPPSVAAAPASSPEPQPAVLETPTTQLSEREEIAKVAFAYWEARGRQGGSAEEDWARAEKEVRSRRLV